MSQTHWKKLYNPDYLGAWALDPGKDLILTIRSVTTEAVTGADGKKENCVVTRFDEPVKPMILNITNAKTIHKMLDAPYIEQWIGHRIAVYSERVKAFGDVVDALRIRPVEPEDPNAAIPCCADCGNGITADASIPAVRVASITQRKYGRALCAACARIQKEKLMAKEEPADASDQ